MVPGFQEKFNSAANRTIVCIHRSLECVLVYLTKLKATPLAGGPAMQAIIYNWRYHEILVDNGHTVLMLIILLSKLRDLVGQANIEKSRAQTDLYPSAHESVTTYEVVFY